MNAGMADDQSLCHPWHSLYICHFLFSLSFSKTYYFSSHCKLSVQSLLSLLSICLLSIYWLISLPLVSFPVNLSFHCLFPFDCTSLSEQRGGDEYFGTDCYLELPGHIYLSYSCLHVWWGTGPLTEFLFLKTVPDSFANITVALAIFWGSHNSPPVPKQVWRMIF